MFIITLLNSCGQKRSSANDDFTTEGNFSQSCQEHLDLLDKLDYSYAWIEAPENYQQKDSLKIKVFYYWKKYHPQQPYIAYFNGGPASNSHGNFGAHWEANQEEHNLVFIDQRGTGCSQQYPSMQVDNIHRYQYYSENEIILDAEMIRAKLAGVDKKWIIFGQSFGSTIVHQYVTNHPQSILAAFAHGAAPTAERDDPFEEIIEKALNQIIVNKQYFLKYPADLKRIKFIKKKIQEIEIRQQVPYCLSKGDTKLCGLEEIIATMGFYLGLSSMWKHIHSDLFKISQFDNNRPDFSLNQFNSIFKKYAFEYLEVDGPIEILMRVNSHIQDIYKNGMFEKRKDFKNKLDKALLAKNLDIDDLVFRAEATFEQGLHSKFITASNNFIITNDVKKLTPLQVIQSLKLNPELKFYLYASQNYTYSPPSEFKEMKTVGLDIIHYHLFVDGDHLDYLKKQKIWDDLDSVYFSTAL